MLLIFRQESSPKNLSIPEGIASVIHCRRTNSRGAAMSDVDEYGIGHFGDLRRQRLGATIFHEVVETGSLVVRQVGADRSGEMSIHNFLSRPEVTPEEIFATVARRTAKACAGRRIVAAQDTTEINFKDRDRARKGLGPAGDGKTPGFFLHGMVAIDAADEIVLGVVHADIWTRQPEKATKRRQRPIEDKESMRWLEGTAAAANVLKDAAQLIVLGDREFDIYAQFARVPPGVELIVRAAQDRKLADDDARLFSAATGWREFGRMNIRVPPHRPGEVARIASVAVKAGQVCISRPRNGADRADPPSVALTLVEVHEIDPPKGHKAIVWRLLTTMQVCGQPDELAAAQEIIQLYRLRWRIEQVFRSMKSDGLRLEETQIHEASRLFKLAAIAFAAAARTIQLVDARDGSRRPASDVADEHVIAAAEVIGPTLEGKTERQKNPHPPRSLSWLAWIVGRLGGWNCYYKPPGPKTMRAGWTRLAAMADGYAIALAAQNE
jgi:Transposase DDE domain